LDRASKIVESIPFGAGLKTSFTGGLHALSSFNINDVNPCGNIEFLPGLEGLRDAVCGIDSLYTNSADYLEKLGGALATTAAINELVPSVETEFNGMKDDLDSLLGDMGTMFDNIRIEFCQPFEDEASARIAGVAKAWASVSFNTCDLTSIEVKVGLKSLL